MSPVRKILNYKRKRLNKKTEYGKNVLCSLIGRINIEKITKSNSEKSNSNNSPCNFHRH